MNVLKIHFIKNKSYTKLQMCFEFLTCPSTIPLIFKHLKNRTSDYIFPGIIMLTQNTKITQSRHQFWIYRHTRNWIGTNSDWVTMVFLHSIRVCAVSEVGQLCLWGPTDELILNTLLFLHTSCKRNYYLRRICIYKPDTFYSRSAFIPDYISLLQNGTLYRPKCPNYMARANSTLHTK